MGLWIGLCLPFIGTSLGAAGVFAMRKTIRANCRSLFIGFAGGVMAAAAVWSLLIPAIEMSAPFERLSFLPALAGFLAGVGFLLLIDHVLTRVSSKKEENNVGAERTSMLFLAVTIHNFPEGAACGAILAGALSEESPVTMAAAVMLAIGIAIQNFPEGAIVSMPLRAQGQSRKKAFLMGVASGMVEPLGAVLTLLLARILTPVLPFMLAFAAGAMIYVVVEELIPQAKTQTAGSGGTLAFSIGFSVMMVLDVMLR